MFYFTKEQQFCSRYCAYMLLFFSVYTRSVIIKYMSLQEKLGQVSLKNSLSTATDTSTKQYRFQLQKTVGLTVNGLSTTNNGEVLMERISHIKDLLKGKTLSTLGKQVSTSKHPSHFVLLQSPC